jgi:hypothetical protein
LGKSLQDIEGDGGRRLAAAVTKELLDPPNNALDEGGFDGVKGKIRVDVEGLEMAQVGFDGGREDTPGVPKVCDPLEDGHPCGR